MKVHSISPLSGPFATLEWVRWWIARPRRTFTELTLLRTTKFTPERDDLIPSTKAATPM